MNQFIVIRVPEGTDKYAVAAAASLGLAYDPDVPGEVGVLVLSDDTVHALMDGLEAGADDYAYRADYEAGLSDPEFDIDIMGEEVSMADFYQAQADRISEAQALVFG